MIFTYFENLSVSLIIKLEITSINYPDLSQLWLGSATSGLDNYLLLVENMKLII